jgi:predicted ribosome quality control (RQC) complex YloA/Tae2 family protein
MLRARRFQEEAPDPFAALLDRELAGAILTAIETMPWDRVVRLRLRLPRRDDGATVRNLVVELLGRSANLLLLDEADTILAFCRDPKSAFRAPAVGHRYEPPPGREAYAGLRPGPLDGRLISEKFASPAEFLAPLCKPLALDLPVERPGERLEEILRAVGDEVWSPVVYSVRPLEAYMEGDAAGRDEIVPLALPVRSPERVFGGERLVAPQASPSEATEIACNLLERLRDFRDRRDHLAAQVRHEVERCDVLLGKLEREIDAARRSEDSRRLAESLLAGLRTARVEANEAVVPDPYDPSGALIRVPIDPAQSLQENAQLLFARWKKGRRGMVTIGKRIEAVRRRRDEWRGLETPAAAARTQADLDRLKEAMGRLGLVHAAPAKTKGATPRLKEIPARVRRFTSPDGLVILVGKSGEENDTLTFRVASPNDFWLHAAGQPGAHVVVRNPQRLKSLPEPTLRAAAQAAAFYSGARAEGKVEVHYTQRRYVHKRKGMPSGQVLLRRFRSIQVAPRPPASTLEDV